jgi:two-component system heavy metal sensor histidine kinase CusS
VLVTAAFLYWTSIRTLDREDDRLLGDRTRVLVGMLANRPGNVQEVRREVFEEWDAHQRTPVHVRVLDSAGQVLVETPGMNKLLPPALFPPPDATSETGSEVHSPVSGSFRVLSVAANPDGTDGRAPVVQVAMDRSLEAGLAQDYRTNFLLVLGVGLFACAAVGYAIARRGIRPIHGLTATASRITSASLEQRMSPGGLPAELLTLAATMNQMLERLEDSFKRLSRFSADIAHELRTPVSSLRGEIEVALGKPRSPEEYREVLGSSLEECGRLTRLIERMLFLARAENPRTEIGREPCDLAVELARVGEFYQPAATEAGIQMNIQVEPSGGRVEVDVALFQRAIGNLLANALAHTPASGSVSLQGFGDSGSVSIVIRDSGRGIPAQQLPHVFDRFYRGDQARSSKHGSIGLGLPIVRSIMDLHEGSIRIESEEGKGTCVTLVFPRQRPT